MIDRQWPAAGLLFLSLALWLSRPWFQSRQAKTQSWQRWLNRTAEFFYFVGFPYFAIVFGVLTTRHLGLKGLEHFGLIHFAGDYSATSIGVQIQQATTLMLVEWLVDSSVVIVTGLIALIILGGVTLGLTRSGIEIVVSRTSAIDTVYDSLHWAFYRAIFWLITEDLYLGVILGASAVVLEGLLLARLQGNWQTQQVQLLLRINILILTSVIFFYRPNLWLLWPVHLAMAALVRNISATRGPDAPVERGKFYLQQ